MRLSSHASLHASFFAYPQATVTALSTRFAHALTRPSAEAGKSVSKELSEKRASRLPQSRAQRMRPIDAGALERWFIEPAFQSQLSSDRQVRVVRVRAESRAIPPIALARIEAAPPLGWPRRRRAAFKPQARLGARALARRPPVPAHARWLRRAEEAGPG